MRNKPKQAPWGQPIASREGPTRSKSNISGKNRSSLVCSGGIEGTLMHKSDRHQEPLSHLDRRGIYEDFTESPYKFDIPLPD
jgi:hypothetical protein